MGAIRSGGEWRAGRVAVVNSLAGVVESGAMGRRPQVHAVGAASRPSLSPLLPLSTTKTSGQLPAFILWPRHSARHRRRSRTPTCTGPKQKTRAPKTRTERGVDSMTMATKQRRAHDTKTQTERPQQNTDGGRPTRRRTDADGDGATHTRAENK